MNRKPQKKCLPNGLNLDALLPAFIHLQTKFDLSGLCIQWIISYGIFVWIQSVHSQFRTDISNTEASRSFTWPRKMYTKRHSVVIDLAMPWT